MNGSICDDLEGIVELLNKTIVIDIFRELLNINLSDFRFTEKKYLKKITEYDFSVLKYVGNIDNKKIEFYIKLVKGGEIKKSVFCCWSLLQEENEGLFNKDSEDKEKNNKLEKISIKEEENIQYKKSVHISMNGDLDSTFQVNFIELRQFIERFNPDLLIRFKKIKLSDNDILLIMVKDWK